MNEHKQAILRENNPSSVCYFQRPSIKRNMKNVHRCLWQRQGDKSVTLLVLDGPLLYLQQKTIQIGRLWDVTKWLHFRGLIRKPQWHTQQEKAWHFVDVLPTQHKVQHLLFLGTFFEPQNPYILSSNMDSKLVTSVAIIRVVLSISKTTYVIFPQNLLGRNISHTLHTWKRKFVLPLHSTILGNIELVHMTRIYVTRFGMTEGLGIRFTMGCKFSTIQQQ